MSVTTWWRCPARLHLCQMSTALHVSGEVWGSSQSALCFTPDTMTLLATTIIIFITTCSSLLTVSAEEEVEGRFLFGNPTLGMRWSECQLWLDTTGWCCGWVRSQCSSTCAGRDCATPCSGRCSQCSGWICHIVHPMLDNAGIVCRCGIFSQCGPYTCGEVQPGSCTSSTTTTTTTTTTPSSG